MCRVTVPRESDSGAIGGESRRNRPPGQSRKRNRSQGHLLLRTLRPMPSIDGQRSKCKNRDSENSRSKLQPHTTRVRATICFDCDYGNYGLNRCLQFTDESIPPPWQRLDKARTLRRIPQYLANFVNGGIYILIDIRKSGLANPP